MVEARIAPRRHRFPASRREAVDDCRLGRRERLGRLAPAASARRLWSAAQSRTAKPTPASRSAKPITMLKSESCVAM